MSNRNTHNSILFLTTLGVYLGLVLVGASPVLGHAAMTRNFEIKDEIEVKDDLDKKPDGCDRNLGWTDITDLEIKHLWFNHRSISEYGHLLEQVLDAYPKTAGEIDISWSSIGDLKPSRRVAATITLPVGDKSASELDRDVVYVGNALPGTSFSFSVFRNRLEDRFRFESRSVPYDPALVQDLYNAAFDYYRCTNMLQREEVILKHTLVNVEGTSLVITTRLPRGSLDAPLAQRAM